jgi:hypothetical protein
LIGLYENFPENYHGIARFYYKAPEKKFQEIILKALHELIRKDGFDFPSIYAVSECKVNFDVGIADVLTFNYLDNETLTEFSKIVKAPLHTLDFLFVIRYYKKNVRNRLKPLKFDYFILRFLFNNENVEFLIFHEKGTRRISLEELTKIISNRVAKELSENNLPKMKVEYGRAL